MKLGFILPHLGQAASPEAIIKVAQRAEELGYDSLWVTDRTLFPANPQTPYMGGMPLPEPYKIVIDPLQTLTFAAAHTSRIRLGTSVLVMGYYNPLILARRLTALDVLSNGRLQVGLGQGWSKDEHDAVGVSLKDRAARADEFVQLLKAIWTQEEVEFEGQFFQLPKSSILPKPIQKPHPPIYLGTYSPGGMKRLALYANGWNPAGLPNADMWEAIKNMATEAGRDPSELKMVIRANLNLTESPLDDERWPFNGSIEQVKADIEAAKAFSAHELFFDPTLSPAGASLDSFLKTLEQMKELVA